MKSWIRWLPSFIGMAAIFYFSSRTGDDLGGWLDQIRLWIPVMEGFDWGHFVSYYGLALAYLWGIRPKRLNWRTKLLVIAMCVGYGVTDEYHQMFVPGRTPDVMDLRNDAIGAALAMLTVSIPGASRFFER